jgi:hypothetical protein
MAPPFNAVAGCGSSLFLMGSALSALILTTRYAGDTETRRRLACHQKFKTLIIYE